MILQLNGISKSYLGDPILSKISMKLERGDRIGLIGVNGAGKSTLLKIITGELSYDEGDIFIGKGIKLGYLRQDSGLQPDHTIWAEMLGAFTELQEAEKELRELEMQMGEPSCINDPEKLEQVMKKYASKSDWFSQQGGYDVEAKINSMLNGMGFGSTPTNTLVASLSGGQKTRLALAKILLEQPDLLLLDEPTNHLDFATLNWLESYLRGYQGAILVISHDRYFLDALVHEIYEIERTHGTTYSGNYSKYLENKAKNRELMEKKYTMQQQQIAKMENYIEQNIAMATSSKSAKNKRKQLERISRLEKPHKDLKHAQMAFATDKKSHKEVLKVKDVVLSYQLEDSRKTLVQDIEFSLYRGDRVALVGPNGVGKSTLLKALLHELTPDRGVISWGNGVTIGYYDQEQESLHPNNTILHEVWGPFPSVDEARIRSVLGNFLFTKEDVFKKIASLSGGEKARVALAKLILQKANVLIMDEPTNHLDLFSKEVLEEALLQFDGTLLCISHDRYFLNKLANKLLELSPTGMTAFSGNYDDYVQKISH